MRLYHKKEIWIPSFAGWLLLLAAAAAFFCGAVLSAYPFLAQHDPVYDARILIVEGWLDDSALLAAVEQAGDELLFVATGGPVEFGGTLFAEKTYAEVTASRLMKAGVPPERIVCAPAPKVQCDRTYAAARSARESLERRGLFGQPVNLCSLGAHSRRSFYMYRLVFGPDYPLGVVSLESCDYDLRHWWRSSLAFKHLLGELISWMYTLFSSCKYA